MTSHHQAEKKELGFSDLIAAAVLFWLTSWGLYYALEKGVPGLFKLETLQEVQLSGAIFLAFWAVLGSGLIKPFMAVAIEREERTTGALQAAAIKVKEGRETTMRIEKELKESRIQAIILRDQAADLAKKEVQKLIEAAAARAEAEKKAAIGKIHGLQAQARQELAAEAEKIAAVVMERALTGAVRVVH